VSNRTSGACAGFFPKEKNFELTRHKMREHSVKKRAAQGFFLAADFCAYRSISMSRINEYRRFHSKGVVKEEEAAV
jgi:hypothetical protein